MTIAHDVLATSQTEDDPDAGQRSSAGWRGRLKKESAERGWLFSVVAGWCAAVGLLCLVASAAAGLRWLWVQDASGNAVVRLSALGVAILLATHWMWRLNVWGRNIAVVSVACLCWIAADAVSRRTGLGPSTQALTLAFAAMSLACFTSRRVRELFAPVVEDDAEDSGRSQDAGGTR